MFEEFQFLITADNDSDYVVEQRSSDVAQFQDSNFDIVKMQAEIWCKKHGFNALIDYHVYTNDSGKVCLEGTPAVVRLNYVEVTKKVADMTVDAGLGVAKAAWSAIFGKK